MQANWKSNGEPTVLRMTDGNGEMNPNFPKVEMHEVNENHSEILKYHVSNLRAKFMHWFSGVLFIPYPNMNCPGNWGKQYSLLCDYSGQTTFC